MLYFCLEEMRIDMNLHFIFNKMMTQRYFKTRQWVKVTFWGWLLGVFLLIFLSSVLDACGIGNMQFYIGISMGAGVGFTQWRLLKKYSAMPLAWFYYSILGMGLPFLILDFIMDKGVVYKLPLSVALGGLAIGCLQYQLLKKQITNAINWIPFTTLGWTMAAFTTLLIDLTMQIKVTGYMNLVMALLNLLLILAGGLVLGWITAFAIRKLKV